MGEENRQRRYVRRPVQVEFRVRDADDAMGGELLFDAMDISEGGAFLRSDFLMEVGDRLDVSFTLPSGESLHVPTAVVWVTPHARTKGEAGMGLRFLELSPNERQAILAYMESYCASQVPGEGTQIP